MWRRRLGHGAHAALEDGVPFSASSAGEAAMHQAARRWRCGAPHGLRPAVASLRRRQQTSWPHLPASQQLFSLSGLRLAGRASGASSSLSAAVAAATSALVAATTVATACSDQQHEQQRQQQQDSLGQKGCDIYTFTLPDLDGKPFPLSSLRRDYPVLLVVNIATQ